MAKREERGQIEMDFPAAFSFGRPAGETIERQGGMKVELGRERKTNSKCKAARLNDKRENGQIDIGKGRLRARLKNVSEGNRTF